MNKYIIAAAFILFLVFEWYYYGLETPATPPPPAAATSPGAAPAAPAAPPGASQEQRLSNFYLIDAKRQSSNQQNKELEVWADSAHKPMSSNEWNMQAVKAQFYSANSTYIVTGRQGVVDEVKNSMVIEGDVKINSTNGYLFYTDSLKYDPQLRQITTDAKVSLEGPQEKEGRLYLEGVRLSIDIGNNVMVMHEQVKGYKPMSGQRTMNISSQQAEFSGKSKSVSFKNNVVIKVDKMNVRGNFAKFQYADGKLDTLYMDGGIHLQDPDKNGSAGEAIVYFNEDKYIFRKKPFVTQNDNELIGDEIIVYNGGKRVQVKNAKVQYFETPEKKK